MQNQSNLERMHQDARAVFDAALQAVDPESAIKRHVTLSGRSLKIGSRNYALDRFDKVFVVGAGKATAPMARALEQILGDRIADGVIVVKDGHAVPLDRVRIHEAGHPVPDDRGVKGTAEILSLVESASENDFVICLISGGGSALLVAPAQGLTLEDKQSTTRHLLACGATIHEINTVRKHLSRVKGGWLAKLASPSTLATLVLSDVVGDDLDVIASGPTVADPSTFKDARKVFDRYDIWDRTPKAVKERIEKGRQGGLPDTPKVNDPVFEQAACTLVGTNLQALLAGRDKAHQLGYQPIVLTSRVEGEAREVARFFSGMGLEIQVSSNPSAAPACVLAGGETTVTLRGSGKGGRNQEFALAAALALEGTANIVVLSGGTDGTDGPTDAAGAISDGQTLQRARAKGMDAQMFLRDNDAYHFFKPLDNLLITGPTRTNVMDLYLLLVR
jgi:hydroxypyruvate reductase